MLSSLSAAWIVASLSAAPGQPTVVAVFDIELGGFTLKKTTLDALDEYLFTKIAGTRGFSVVPRAEVRRRLNVEKAESYRECYDQSCQIEIGKELAAEKTISTKVLKLGEECLVSVVLYDLKSAATDGAAESTGPCTTGGLMRSLESAAKALVPAAAVVAPPPMVIGVEDRKLCPGGRRIGDPHPAGSSATCVNDKGMPNGASLAWYPNGQLSMRTEFKDGKMHGEQVIFQKDGAPAEKGRWENGQKTGEWVRYNAEGKEYERGKFERGQRVGKWIRLDRDGKVESETHYVDDMRDGPYVEYHPDGTKEEEGRYGKDKKQGLWIEYSKSGKKDRETHYVDDRQEGVRIEYDSRGEKERVSHFTDGKRHGIDERYRRSGTEVRLEVRAEYQDNELHGVQSWFDADGMERLREHYVRGKKDGKHTAWTGKGDARRVSEEGQYRAGEKTGVWKRFDAEGRVTLEETWDGGERNGRTTGWGKSIRGEWYKQYEGTYVADEKHGDWKRFDPGGAVTETKRFERGKEVK